jgi:hypothetical protein
MSASWNDSRKPVPGRVRPIVRDKMAQVVSNMSFYHTHLKTSYKDDMLRSFYYALNILWKQPCSTGPEFLHIFVCAQHV